jgi:hypothetical protein
MSEHFGELDEKFTRLHTGDLAASLKLAKEFESKMEELPVSINGQLTKHFSEQDNSLSHLLAVTTEWAAPTELLVQVRGNEFFAPSSMVH